MVFAMIVTALTSRLSGVRLEFLAKRGGLAFAFAFDSLEPLGELFNLLHERLVDRMLLLKQGPAGGTGGGDFRNFHDSGIVVNSPGNHQQQFLAR